MITLNDLTPTELQYLRSKWVSQQTEINKEKASKTKRLTLRLNSQGEDAIAKAELEAELTHATAVLNNLTTNNADPALIAAQQAVVNDIQLKLDGFGLSSSYVSNTDAMILQMELDELDSHIALRTAKIAAIDAL